MRQGNAWLVWLTVVVLALSGTHLVAQSGAITGQIEGLVTDPSGASVAGAKVTAVNLGTGLQRETTTEAAGLYRFPLLPLGTYRVTVETQGFNKYEQTGIEITSGSIASINVTLKVGAVAESVTVTGEAPIAEPARIDVGALVNSRSVANLPLISRNPYNFILLQPNVSANPNTEFGVPRKINANGFTDRIEYQLDGNQNTQSDRKGIRLIPISSTFIKEVVVATNGFAPEFGNTVGTVFNAVTRSGVNQFHGDLAYILRRTDFMARESLANRALPKPPGRLDNGFGSVGGPIIHDKLHFFSSFERVNREFPSAITVTDANAAALGLPSSVLGAIPRSQFVTFYLGRTDWQISPNQRLMTRYMYFRNNSPENTGGGLNTRTVASDFIDRAHNVAGQLVSVFRPTLINEMRFQYGYRRQRREFGANSDRGPNMVISGVANLGGPTDVGSDFTEQAPQVVNNLSWVKGAHNLKFGTDLRWIVDENTQSTFARYTFPTIAAYLAAKAGTNIRGYTTFAQRLGDPTANYRSVFMGFFAQDSWTATQRLNLTYGLRYDVYNVPEPDPTSPLAISRIFRIDKNNFAPRFGLAYTLGPQRKTVVRFSSGFFYDTPQTDLYRRGLVENGAARLVNVSLAPTAASAPAFPNIFSAAPSAAIPIQDVTAVAADFATLYSYNANLQVTQELTKDMAVTVGYMYTKGTHIPVTRNINLVNVTGRLADGRAIFSTVAADRLFPQFNNVVLQESVGNSNYNGLSLSVNKRFSHSFQVQALYAWSHAIDDAPEENVLDSGGLTLSDPLSRARDRGNGLSDRRHIITISGVLTPSVKVSNSGLNYFLNNNQFSFLLNGGSGDIFNIVGNRNLTNNAQASSAGVIRPLFIGRNTVRGQSIAQFDMRYSRFIPFKSERYKAEILGEFANLFNHTNATAYNLTAPVDAAGNIILPLPAAYGTATGSRDQRLFQLGFKFIF